jgi:hypothetical protein
MTFTPKGDPMQTQENRILLILMGTVEKTGPGRLEFLPARIVNPISPTEDWQAQGKVKAQSFELTVNDPRLLRDLEPGKEFTLALGSGHYFQAGTTLRR